MRSHRLAAGVAGVVVLLLAAAVRVEAQVRITLAAWPEPVLLDTMRQSHQIDARPDAVYNAVLYAFKDLGIPAGRTDSTRGIIGSERFERTRTLAGSPLSRAFDCGEGPAGPNADSFRLEIAVVVWVEPAGKGTNLGVASIASGRDVTGVFRNPKQCASTGALEVKVLDRIRGLVGG